MSSTGSIISRDLYILEDESNPLGSKTSKVLPSTILDQVYDDQDPTNKTLRTIIEELKQAIATGGQVVINFPVTSVNGLTGDVVITKNILGMDKVDNTSDNEKPLSDPQRDTVMDILANYQFDVDLKDLYDHLLNTNNPHAVTLEQINESGAVTELIQHLIQSHDVNNTSHADIRENISMMEHSIDDLQASVDQRIDAAVHEISQHYNDPNAHSYIMDRKEDATRKVVNMNEESINYDNYPSTRAVAEYVQRAIVDFINSTDFNTGIDDIIVVRSRENLPVASSSVYKRAYFILIGENGSMETAVCRRSEDVYSWDYTDTGLYSNLNMKYFEYDEGLNVKSGAVGGDLLEDSTFLDNLKEIVEQWDIGGGGGHLEDYYTKEEIDAKHFLTEIGIRPGVANGTIRFYINGDITTMSEDIQISGLKALAFLDKVTEEHIENDAVTSDHIRDNAVQRKHMADKSVGADNLTASYMRVFGNVSDDEHKTVTEIPIRALAELFAPVFREILEETGLIQLNEEAVRELSREEIHRFHGWDDIKKSANFDIVDDYLDMEYDAVAGEPDLYLDENGDLIMEIDDEENPEQIEKDLDCFSFRMNQEDRCLWLHIRSNDIDDPGDQEPDE